MITRRGFFGRVVGGVAAAAIVKPAAEPYRSAPNEAPALTRGLVGRVHLDRWVDAVDVTSFGDSNRVYMPGPLRVR